MTSRITAELTHGPGNPRNSEGAFVTLADGRIFTIYYMTCHDGVTHVAGALWRLP